MKNALRFLALAIALATIVSVTGCSSSPKAVAPGKDRLVSMMQMLPSNVSEFSFFDIYTLRTDKNLAAEWSGYNQYFFGNASVTNSMNSFCLVYPNEIGMFDGDFTLNQLLDQLMGSTGTDSYNYGGFNVMAGAANTSIVRINGTAIIGYDEDIRSCIDAVNGNASSLYGNADIKSMVNRLPGGYGFDVTIADNNSAYGNISGLMLVGLSVTASGDNFTQTGIYQFNTSDAAQQYVATASNVSADGAMQIARTQDGTLVTEVLTPLTSTITPTETPALTPEPTLTPTPAP